MATQARLLTTKTKTTVAKKENYKRYLFSNVVFFTIALFLKLYWVRSLVFNDHNIIRTFLLELGPVIILFSLFELLSVGRKTVLYLITDVIFSTLFLALILYSNLFGRIFTYYAFFQLKLVGGIGNSIGALFSPIYLLLYLDIIIYVLLLVMKKNPFRHVLEFKDRIFAVILVLALSLSVLNLYLHQDKQLNVTAFAKTSGILNAEAAEITSGIIKKGPQNTAVSMDNINQVKNVSDKNSAYFGVAKDKNLIVIQVESLQNFPIGLKVNGQEVTPNLNKLAQESLNFQHLYTQIGQGNTSDAEFIVNTSLYPLANGAITSLYGDRSFPSLPKLLTQQGYQAMTFHVNDVHFWDREKLYPALGFEYYDRSFFGNDDIIDMGPSDDVLFKKSMQVLIDHKNKNQKFYANFVTLTSHHPFEIPKGRTNLTLPSDLEGTLVGNYLNAANYDDKALGTFFDNLKQNELWDNSIIAIYGDHFGLWPTALQPSDRDKLSALIGKRYDTIDAFNIPLIMKVPGVAGQVVNIAGGESDFLPTVANLMGIPLTNQIHFGEDLLNNTENTVPIRYYLSDGSYFSNEELYRSDTEASESILTRQTHPVKSSSKSDAVLQLLKMSDSYLNNLPKRGN